MPLIVPPTIAGTYQTNMSVVTETTITAGAPAHNKSAAWGSLIATTTYDTYGFWVRFRNVHTTGTVTNMLVDIAAGTSGGGSESIIAPNLSAGAASAGGAGGGFKSYFVPVFIPAGSSVSAKSQAAIASDTVVVSIWLCQNALYPWASGPVKDYGTDLTTSRGTSVATGNTAFGNWVEIATTARDHRYWFCAMDQLADTSIGNANVAIEIGFGPDTSNVTTILSGSLLWQDVEVIGSILPPIVYHPVAASTKLFARFATSSSTDNGESRGVQIYGCD